jgi:hypothetical protein
VSHVEDVARSTAHRPQNGSRALDRDLGARQERNGVQIALNPAVVPTTVSQASAISTRQSSPMTSPPASAMRGRSAGFPVAKLMVGMPSFLSPARIRAV